MNILIITTMKEYKEKQKEAFKDKEFSANFYTSDVPVLGGYYKDQEKSVNIAFFQIQEDEEATLEYLKQKYGENYMTPVIANSSHEYPFYKKQKRELYSQMGIKI